VPWRAVAITTTWLTGFLSRRALLPLHRALATALPGTHLPPPVAPLLQRAALLHLDHVGIAGLANPIAGPAASCAGRATSGGYLASRTALTDHLSPPSMHASCSAALLAPLSVPARLDSAGHGPELWRLCAVPGR